jgi:hypothetical protein
VRAEAKATAGAEDAEEIEATNAEAEAGAEDEVVEGAGGKATVGATLGCLMLAVVAACLLKSSNMVC